MLYAKLECCFWALHMISLHYTHIGEFFVVRWQFGDMILIIWRLQTENLIRHHLIVMPQMGVGYKIGFVWYSLSIAVN